MSDVLVDGKKGTVEGYRATPDDTFYVQVKEEGKDNAELYPWQEVKDLQGLQMITAPDGVSESPAFDESKKSKTGETPSEKTSSNRKYSLDNSDNLGYNGNRRYSVGEHMAKEHNEVNNRVTLSPDGKKITSIELGLDIDENETEAERIHRRKKEIRALDKQISRMEGDKAFIKLVPDSNKAFIDMRLDKGETGQELIEEYQAQYHEELSKYSETMTEERRIERALILKGAAYYVAEKSNISYDEERSGGIFDGGYEQSRGRDTEEESTEEAAGNQQKSIRPTSRSEESGFSNARSMDDLKVEVKEAFPNAKVQEDGNKLSMTMPNGQKVTFTFHESIALTILSERQNG